MNTATTKGPETPLTMRKAIALVMASSGYKPGAPTKGADEIDRAIIEEAQCHYCAREGLEFHPFTGPGGSYRNFALCLGCGAAVEF